LIEELVGLAYLNKTMMFIQERRILTWPKNFGVSDLRLSLVKTPAFLKFLLDF